MLLVKAKIPKSHLLPSKFTIFAKKLTKDGT